MKMLRNLRLPTLVAAAAIAGFSLSAAYAVPNYTPDASSPVATIGNPDDGGAGLSAGLKLINAQLSGATLVIPAVNAGSTAATKDQFKAAVFQAFGAASTVADKAAVVHAAVAYAPLAKASTLDIVTGTMLSYLSDVGYTEANAVTILNAALAVNNGKSTDVVNGLVLAIGEVGSLTQEAETGDFAGDLYDTAVSVSGYDSAGKAAKLVESLAENFVKNTKPNTPGTLGYSKVNPATYKAAVTDVATDLMSAVVASGAKFAVDDAARGIAKGFMALLSTGLVTYSDAFGAIAAGAGADADDKAHAAAGMIRVLSFTNTAELAAAKAAFNTSITDAVVDGYADISAAADTAARVALVETRANTSPATAAYYALGGAYLSPGLVVPMVEGAMDNLISAADKKAMLAQLSRAQNGQAAKAAGKAVAVGGLLFNEAIESAIPNTLSLYAGAVVKEVAKASPSTTAADLTTASINALETAVNAAPEDNFKGGIIDAVAEIIKIKKTPADISAVITAGIGAADPNSGAAEALAAAIGCGDSKVDHSAALTSAMSLAGPAEIDSVITAERVARLSKTTKNTLGTTLAEIRNASDSSLAAAVLGGAAVDSELASIFMASALREGNGTMTSGQRLAVLNSAKAANKKGEADVQLAYDTASLVLANTDELFDIVSSQTIKFPKSGATIAAAATAAAPGYGHFVARAAGFRASTSSVSKIPLAIFQAADMNANLSDNPSASAAIAAGLISGIMDQKQTDANREKLLASGMFALVKAASTFGTEGTVQKGAVAPTGSFRSVNIDTGAQPAAGPAGANQPEYGTAAAVTGATSVLSNVGDTGLFALDNTSPLYVMLRAAGKAVGKGNHSQMTVIAQAAAQAAVWIAGSGYNVTNIAIAITRGAFNTTTGTPDPRILLAANAGKAEAIAGFKGAGAAGVLDYAHFNTNNSPVTDISNF